MRPVFILFFTLLCLASCSINRLTKIGAYQELPSEAYLTYLNDSTVNIIDVRTKAEYEKSHIDGAINVSYFSGHFKRDLKALEIDKHRTTLIYCETQHRSLFAAKQFHRIGYKKIIDLDKGMMHWRKNDFPYISETSEK